MPPILNPFLRAFFRSTLPTQCSPVHHHILLVPTTEVLLSSRDRESNASYADLSGSEEFLASHVLRVPGGVGPDNHVKDGAIFRESRGKAKQYSTVNGRIVVIKDACAYSNKGFKTLNQAQLLYDTIYYPDTFDSQPWLVYYISKPLVGSYEPTPIIPAIVPGTAMPQARPPVPAIVNVASSSLGRKKEIKSFTDLLNNFPMIARQMHPGLGRLFKEFEAEVGKPLPPTPSDNIKPSSLRSRRRSSLSSTESMTMSIHSRLSHGPNGYISGLELGQEEEILRTCLDTAVTAAIDLFRMVDKNQLSLLGATTELTGPLVERMIERYVTEQVHTTILFPRLCAVHRLEDSELESRMRKMANIDISQVGIDIPGGRKGKQELAVRLARAVDIFKRMGVAGSPQEMLELLLAVEKQITAPEASTAPAKGPTANGEHMTEKRDDLLTVNADTLVSLLLVVVIRSPVRHLLARLAYMRHFIFIDDIESGEMGYALSTFEAVLSYLQTGASGLRKSSRRNVKLWQAAKSGDIATIHSILEPDSSFHEADYESDSSEDLDPEWRPNRFADRFAVQPLEEIDMNAETGAEHRRSSHHSSRSEDGPLAHIFPFQRAPTPPPAPPPKVKKKVSMDVRSMSNSSIYSFRSHTTLDSHLTGFEGDTSIETLSKTHGIEGNSVLMMAVEAGQDKILQYLLSLTEYYPLEFVVDDCNSASTTLLSAAVQHAHAKTTDVLLDYLLDNCPSDDALRAYFAKQDSMGRSMAHYLFHQPELIDRIGYLVSWRLKDRNGQTPVFALCRSYDHEDYREMVSKALVAATQEQDDGQPLHLDEHIDSKGNTLLHIVNDPFVAIKLLYRCDSDVNAPNDKHFTPLMVASKYGRTELVRVLFQDARVDLSARDIRGLTAAELAKDDEVRNRIDDLVLMSNEPAPDGRITSVVRSFFVEDGTVRLVVKSAAPSGNSCITVTTCRRSVRDFESLAKWLAQEQPASWLPSLASLQSPFLIPSRPSRSILRDIQLRLDAFLKTLLLHPTFSTHEMVWEFFLVPELEPPMLAERSARKAEARKERIRDEYAPLYDVREVELFVQHARETVRSVHHASRSVLRRTNKLRHTAQDLVDAARLASTAVKSLPFMPQTHLAALDRYTNTLVQSEASPLAGYYYSTLAISDTIAAILAQLSRPSKLISQMSATQKLVDRHMHSMRRSDRWPALGILDDKRETQEKADAARKDLAGLAKELRYTQQVVASELASWQDSRVSMGRKALRELARRMVVGERARLDAMKRAIRGLGTGGEKGARGRRNGASRGNGNGNGNGVRRDRDGDAFGRFSGEMERKGAPAPTVPRYEYVDEASVSASGSGSASGPSDSERRGSALAGMVNGDVDAVPAAPAAPAVPDSPSPDIDTVFEPMIPVQETADASAVLSAEGDTPADPVLDIAEEEPLLSSPDPPPEPLSPSPSPSPRPSEHNALNGS